MSIVDILVMIIVVTILVTIVLGVTTYLAYKLRLARRPSGGSGSPPEPRYFRPHEPPAESSAETAVDSMGAPEPSHAS